MKVTVQVFANLKDFYDPEFTLELPDASVAADVSRRLAELNPAGGPLLGACRIAVDDSFVDAGHPLRDNAEVLVMPPSSGG